MIVKMKTVLEKFSAAFAVLFIGLIVTNYMLDLFVKALHMMFNEPFQFIRYFLIVTYVLYGLSHAAAWYLESQTKDQS
jgi:cation transporter-like permease